MTLRDEIPSDLEQHKRGAGAVRSEHQLPNEWQRASLHKSLFVAPESFFEIVDRRMDKANERGALAYLEVVRPFHEQAREPAFDPRSPESDYSQMIYEIGRNLASDDLFCWHAGRFIVLINRLSCASRTLRLVSQALTNREWSSNGSPAHLTPVIGYFDMRLATSASELWNIADEALERAKSSLEVTPLRYVKSKSRSVAGSLLYNTLQLWAEAPQWLVLLVQLVVSLIIGLGGPFILYAICDALGSDISGPVYIGVVIVLVITATTILIESFLALKPTTPPEKPGSPYPIATIIIPAYLPNEAETIMETLHAFLKLRYSNVVQIIVAYNCPSPHMVVEDEMKALAAQHAPFGRFIIDPVRVAGSTSKAQNVNAVVGRVRGRFVGIFDADHHPHEDSLERAWRWLSNGWDIVQGRCAIRNGNDSWVARMVAVEFEQIYAVSHPGRARFHGFGIFGGSNGFWRTSVLHETRMRHSMLTEDIDSSIRAVVAGYKITGDRDLVSEELAPTDLKQLLNQRLRWAQGWFQVSFRRVMPALLSPRVSLRQKLGLIHLLIWREMFPWYSIQVVPIMTYWIWVYGWAYIHWAVPIFLATTVYTFSTGPVQIILAYRLAQKPMKRRIGWFIEYFFVSTLFYSLFKDALSRIAHIKEAMRERAWKVTPRSVSSDRLGPLATASFAIVILGAVVPNAGRAQGISQKLSSWSTFQVLETLIGGEASTVNAARVAVREGHHALAASLFEKAIRDVPSRRGELLREYADSLAYSNRAAAAVPLYRELLLKTRSVSERRDVSTKLANALAQLNQESVPANIGMHRAGTAQLKNQDASSLVGVPAGRLHSPSEQSDSGSGAYLRTQRMLANSLTLQGRGDQAIDAWSSYLRYVPRDEDALMRQATLLSQLRRDGQARVAFQAVLVLDRGNIEARGALADVTVRLAHKAAGEDRNRDAQAMLEEAIRLNPRLRRQILNDYADLLSFNGRANDAVPLYQEILITNPITPAERKRALVGLANSYTWSNRLKEAIAAYADLIVLYPGDANLQWNALVVSARDAAQNDRNVEAADYFSKAIALKPDESRGILREYADQLSFTDRSVQAVPLYQQVLLQGSLTDKDRALARLGLAQAYEWSGHLELAESSYRDLLRQSPTDLSLQWKLLVVSARIAAHEDRNSDSEHLFANAIALVPDRSMGLLREYADQLSFTGQARTAVAFYAISLKQPHISVSERGAAQRGRAQALDWAGKFVDAKAAYAALLADAPGDTLLRWHLLVVTAREAASEDRNKDAAQFLAQAIRLIPARRTSILQEYADKLSYSNQSKFAIPLYQELLRAEDQSPKLKRGIMLSLAQALAFSHKFDESLRVYSQLLEADPTDLNAAFERARTMSWAGRQSDAKLAFQEILSKDPGNSKAQRGLAEAEDFDGNHRAAQELLNARLEVEPGDLEARRLLAQSLLWSGRPDEAMQEINRALASEPDRARAKTPVTNPPGPSAPVAQSAFATASISH